MSPAPTSVHASAVLIGDRAVLIRGPSGSGKSRLVFELILASQAGQIPEAMLVADDRAYLEASDGRLRVRPVPELVGLLEIRGLGIRRLDCATAAIVGLVVDLDAPDAARLPDAEALQIELHGIRLPRIPVESSFNPLPLIVAHLTTADGIPPLRR
ncbi:serine kinase [Tardiphaga alba]|uniref:Serine kinase n=1 Tax=Tardiphaga alba TaxID=340268 RepID=A0ABX8A4I5_9BRAD|nr:HPr kinase/phosphatase C-terminal domain-containing protein [Tardiphaga alba]QUS38196.1 serine kinase [Tardiphaga alba]